MADSRLEALIQRTTGLSLQTVGTGFIDAAVKARMLKAGLRTADEYVQLIESDPAELQELVEAVVVPETWFFRDPEAFAALGNWATQEWAPSHPGEVLRVFSVPCSTGEEPYSIAICLLNAGLALSQFEVTAMDISTRNLAVAETSIYRPYAFRGTAPVITARFFRQTNDGMRLDEAIRAQVSFQAGNVLESLDSLPTGGFDVVFCRNLLIYFDRTVQLHTLNQIERLLARDGVLFVGSAEAFMVRAFGCTALSHPMSFGFRLCKETSAPPQTKKSVVAPRAAKARPPASTIKPPPRSTPLVKTSHKQPPAAATVSKSDDLNEARQLADRGEFARSRILCESAISKAGDCAECYFLLGLIDDAENLPDRAAAHYRKALYLEPRHAEALSHMAHYFEKLGDTGKAERLRLRMRNVLAKAPEGTK